MWNFVKLDDYRLEHAITSRDNALDLPVRSNGPLIGVSFYMHGVWQ